MTRHGTFRNDEWSCVDAMAAGELSRLGIAEAADRLRCGELTAVDYASSLLERQHIGRRRMRMRSPGSNQTVRLKRPARRMREESGGRAWHYCMACLLHSRTTSTSREPAYNGLQTGSVDLAIGECAACPETLFCQPRCGGNHRIHHAAPSWSDRHRRRSNSDQRRVAVHIQHLHPQHITGRWCMWMAQPKPERSCSGLKLVRHTESSAADVHQLQDRGLASGDRRQAVVGIGGSPRMAAAGP